MSSTTKEDSASYIALVPRGLHHVFVERLRNELNGGGYALNDVCFVGERNDNDEKHYKQHLAELLSKRKKQHTANIGSVMDPSTNQHVSVGYHTHHGGAKTTIWSFAGTASSVWVHFSTNAPVDFFNEQLRFIGPLMACVQVWENVDLNDKTGLEQVKKIVSELDFLPAKLDKALQLWYMHVQDSWPLSQDELDDIANKMQGQEGSTPLTYRLSCFRAHSKHYSYTREQFVRIMADYVVPSERKWKVNLCNYNVEVVLLVQANCLAVGLALRPYRQVQANSFSTGGIPPDVTKPFISGSALSGLVRLRPTTAQLLWGLLDLGPGDVVLDPCAGIGTIPLEVPSGVVGLGGDLILNSDECRPLAVEYLNKMHQHNASCKANLLAWDAALLPLRTSCVDAVVSDLPFGQQCLSSAKLDSLLPLIMGEVARVLRPGGMMLLLCGAYPSILDSLVSLDELQTDGLVWKLPCEAVFPVNIGGLIAWVVKVQRGPAEAVPVANHVGRVQKLVSKREHASRRERYQKNASAKEVMKDGGLKYRRLQK